MFHAIFVNNLRVRGVSENVSSRTLARRPNTPNLGKKHPSGGWGLMSGRQELSDSGDVLRVFYDF